MCRYLQSPGKDVRVVVVVVVHGLRDKSQLIRWRWVSVRQMDAIIMLIPYRILIGRRRIGIDLEDP